MAVGKSLGLMLGALLCVGVSAVGCAPAPGAGTESTTAGTVLGAPGPPGPGTRAPSGTGALPGVGPFTRSRLPADTRQVFVVAGATVDSSRSHGVLYERDDRSRWRARGGPWPVHNGLRGWTHRHHAGDLRSPIGVFGLRDAGGRLPNPGGRLPYHQDAAFTISGTGHLGEPLAGSFDHVVAIDYNRVPGRSPLDGARPMGADRGGGIWIHVDHEGPTSGCLSLRPRDMRDLLRALDPVARPVVLMGPGTELAR
ncbi:L,D-transpeptidase family protein [Streptomyces sp. ZYX-F-203]